MLKTHIALLFLTNFRVGMVSFVNPHKVVGSKNAFSALPRTRNGGELEGVVSKKKEKKKTMKKRKRKDPRLT